MRRSILYEEGKRSKINGGIEDGNKKTLYMINIEII